MRRPALLLGLFLAGVAFAQTAPAAPPAASPSTEHEVIARASDRPDSGALRGNTFYSDFFRFSFSLPTGFTAQDRDAIHKDIKAGHEKLHPNDDAAQEELLDVEEHAFVLLSAEGHLDGKKPLSQVMIGAEELPADITTADDYARYSETDPVLAQLQFKPLHPATPMTIGGRHFVRKDYTANAHVVGTDVTAAYAEYVTVDQGYALVVSFWSDNEADLATLCKQIDTLRFGDFHAATPAAAPAPKPQ